MDYIASFIPNKTIEELQEERSSMYANQYKYGYMVSKCRLWDIEYSIKKLIELEQSRKNEIAKTMMLSLFSR